MPVVSTVIPRTPPLGQLRRSKVPACHSALNLQRYTTKAQRTESGILKGFIRQIPASRSQYQPELQSTLYERSIFQPHITYTQTGNEPWCTYQAALCYPSQWAPPDPTFQEIATTAEHDTELDAIPPWA
ncbi:hypothetical protein M9H77_27098 [Catharanthus roseus]|uniref:Uncharacterized protein n=1 Tax=Catharanthus roseus TaxID=4058 RepID=A0ACC0AD48_CATRO|nr:hypothetical protein M9H77_27098 [Catharanthus roseus]